MSIRTGAALVALALGASVSLLAGAGELRRAAAGAAPGAPAFDAAAAATYLDARMDMWWAKAKTLKSGDTETKCLSCHTAVPYALARPLLRRAMAERTPTAHETRIVDTVRTRLAHLDRQQPFYDHTADKTTESRGVEAVLSAFLMTSHDTERGAATPAPETAQAMARLWDVQRADGAWQWLNFGLEPYESTDAVFHGATLAALAAGSPAGAAASGTPAGIAGLRKLRGYLTAQQASQRLFNRTWALLASSRLTGVLTPPERDAIVAALAATQQADGGWSLADLGGWRWSSASGPYAAPGTTDAALLAPSDAYATALAVYAMKQAGLTSHPSVAKGVGWLVAHQQPARSGDAAWAPWRAHSLNFDREHGGDKGEPWRRMFMSDLATAFAVLALLS